MWIYEKKLQYPVRIKNPNPKLAQIIISQYGGPDGELGASLRYLSQRYSMPYAEAKGALTDIGIEDKYCAFTKKVKNIYEGVLFFLIDILIFSLVFPHGTLRAPPPFLFFTREEPSERRLNLGSSPYLLFMVLLNSPKLVQQRY